MDEKIKSIMDGLKTNRCYWRQIEKIHQKIPFQCPSGYFHLVAGGLQPPVGIRSDKFYHDSMMTLGFSPQWRLIDCRVLEWANKLALSQH